MLYFLYLYIHINVLTLELLFTKFVILDIKDINTDFISTEYYLVIKPLFDISWDASSILSKVSR